MSRRDEQGTCVQNTSTVRRHSAPVCHSMHRDASVSAREERWRFPERNISRQSGRTAEKSEKVREQAEEARRRLPGGLGSRSTRWPPSKNMRTKNAKMWVSVDHAYNPCTRIRHFAKLTLHAILRPNTPYLCDFRLKIGPLSESRVVQFSRISSKCYRFGRSKSNHTFFGAHYDHMWGFYWRVHPLFPDLDIVHLKHGLFLVFERSKS